MNADMLSAMLGQKQYGKMLYFSPWQWIPENCLRKDEVRGKQWHAVKGDSTFCFPTTIRPWFLPSKIGALIFFFQQSDCLQNSCDLLWKKNVLELWIMLSLNSQRNTLTQDRLLFLLLWFRVKWLFESRIGYDKICLLKELS